MSLLATQDCHFYPVVWRGVQSADGMISLPAIPPGLLSVGKKIKGS